MKSKKVIKVSTATRILDVAERLIQEQGYNGFSYADISSEVGITKPSLHHHFRTKAELGVGVIDRYQLGFFRALGKIDESTTDSHLKLSRYAGIYGDVLKKNRMCLCGILASEFATLPKAMREGVNRFFDANDLWLTQVLKEGRRSKVLQFNGAELEMARFVVGSLEGAMSVARAYNSVPRFEVASKRLLETLACR